MRALIPAIFCPSILLYLIFISGKNSSQHPRYIQVSDNELFAYSLFLWLVFIVFAINSFNSSGGLGITPRAKKFLISLPGYVCCSPSQSFYSSTRELRRSIQPLCKSPIRLCGTASQRKLPRRKLKPPSIRR